MEGLGVPGSFIQKNPKKQKNKTFKRAERFINVRATSVCLSTDVDADLFRLSLQHVWRSVSGPVASSGSVAAALTALQPPLSGTPSQAFPTSSGGDQEVVLLARQQSAGLWLGKAAARCSHHLPL